MSEYLTDPQSMVMDNPVNLPSAIQMSPIKSFESDIIRGINIGASRPI